MSNDFSKPPTETILTAEGAAHALHQLSRTLSGLIILLRERRMLSQAEIDAILPPHTEEAPGADVISFHMHCLLTGATPPRFTVIQGGKDDVP